VPEADSQPSRVVDALGPTDPTSIGPFRLLGRLGSGGMGRVYLGQSAAGRLVAVKVIREDWAEDATFQRRFARELAAARTVSPLYTAAVIAAEPDASPPWFATTYIEGPSLARHVGATGPMRPAAVLTLAAGLAEALSSMHGAGLVHRDLKPSNVLLSPAGPHVIDFGIALPAGATRLTSSIVVGTPAYVAPERLDGNEDSTAGDVFSLGSTLFFASTGRSLLGSGTMEVQLARLTRAKFDLSDLPRGLRPIATRCLAKAPKDRPTAAELVRLLVASGAQPASDNWYARGAAARHNGFVPSRRDHKTGDEKRGDNKRTDNKRLDHKRTDHNRPDNGRTDNGRTDNERTDNERDQERRGLERRDRDRPAGEMRGGGKRRPDKRRDDKWPADLRGDGAWREQSARVSTSRGQTAIEAPRSRAAPEGGPGDRRAGRTPAILDAATAWVLPRRRLVAYGALAVSSVAGVGWLLRGENRPRQPLAVPVVPADMRWRYHAAGQQTPLVVPAAGGPADLIIDVAGNEVRAYQAGTDRTAWSRPADAPMVIGAGWPHTVVVAETGRYSAVGAADGLQRFEVPASAAGIATIPNASALVLVGEDEFIAVNQDGSRLTSAGPGSDLRAFTAVGAAANLIFVAQGVTTPSVTAIDLGGTRVWRWTPSDAIAAAGGRVAPGKIHTLLADRTRVYAAAELSLTALDRAGKPLWAAGAAPTGIHRPANSLDRPDLTGEEAVDLVIVTEKKLVSARVAGSGALLWQQPAGADAYAVALNPSGDTVYVARNGFLDLLEADTGRVSRRIRLPDDTRVWRPNRATVTTDTAYLHFGIGTSQASAVLAVALP
jgi:serine/threonine protein kinase